MLTRGKNQTPAMNNPQDPLTILLTNTSERHTIIIRHIEREDETPEGVLIHSH